MGADIYLRRINDAARDKWQRTFDEAVKARDAHYKAHPDQRPDTMALFNRTYACPYQKKVDEAYEAMYAEGYFRDSYNPSSLFWLLGLSWWKDVGALLGQNGLLPVENAKVLRQMILDAGEITPERVRTYLDAKREDFGVNVDVNGWTENWIARRAALLALIDRSIQLDEPLYCSI